MSGTRWLTGPTCTPTSSAKAGVAKRATVLADALEAALGALYMDGGLDPARNFVRRAWNEAMTIQAVPPKDAKTTLQEWVQARGLPLPDYQIIATEGPAHKRRFTVRVKVEGLENATASATGSSKRAAEIAAAAAALNAMGNPA